MSPRRGNRHNTVDGSTVVLGSDRAGHVDSRTILPAGGGWDQEVVNAAGQTSAIVSHGADGSQIVQAFTTGGAPGAAQTLSYQSLYDAAGVETQALLVGADGSRTQESYGADGRVASASVTRADGTVVSAASYGAGGAQTSATTLNSDGSHTVLGFDAAGRVQRVSFTHDDGSGASFVVEAGGLITPGQAVLNQVSVALAEQILAQPADGKHTVSQKVTLPDGELYNVTMGAAGNIVAKHEHPNGIGQILEEVAGAALNVLAVIPGPDVVAAPLAVAWDLSQAGEDFSQGNVLGGVLNLGSAAGVGIVGAAQGAFGSGAAQDLGTIFGATTVAGLRAIGTGVLEGTALVGGVSGIAQGVASGDPVAIAAGGLEVASAGLSGLVTSGQLDPALGADAAGIASAKATSLLAGQVALGAGVGSAVLGSADAAEHGDWVGSLGGLLAAAASSGPAVADDLFGTAQAPGGAGPQGGSDGPDVLPGAQGAAVQPVTQEDLPAPPAAAGGGAATAATIPASVASIGTMAQAAAASTAAQAGGGVGASGGGAGTAGGGTTTPGGGATAGAGQAGAATGDALDGSQQSGGLPQSNAGAATSGSVHIDVEPISVGYAPAGGASTPAGSDESAAPVIPLVGATSGPGTVFSPAKEGYHFYQAGPNLVAPANLYLTPAQMADQMSRFAVPGQSPDQPVQSGKTYRVYAPITGTFVGNVTTTVSSDGLTTSNETAPGHLLYDGQITRSAIENPDGSWSVITSGIGNNIYPGMATVNEEVGPDIFNNVDEQMRQNITKIYGS